MTLSQLQYFLTAAKYLSITVASKKHYLTQPALSRQIQSLEDEIGARLFVRSKQALSLTPSGQLLYQKLPELLNQLNVLLAEAKDVASSYEGILRIGILADYDMSGVLRPLLSLFEQHYPNIQVMLTRLPLDDLFASLSTGTLDIIYTYEFLLHGSEDLVSTVVQKFDLCVILHQQHPLSQKESLTLEDIYAERLVQLRSDFKEDGRQYLLGTIPMEKQHHNVIIVDKVDDLPLWVEVGKAIAVVSSFTTMRHNPQIAIRKLNVAGVNGLYVSVTWHKRNQNPAVTAFSELTQMINVDPQS